MFCLVLIVFLVFCLVLFGSDPIADVLSSSWSHISCLDKQKVMRAEPPPCCHKVYWGVDTVKKKKVSPQRHRNVCGGGKSSDNRCTCRVWTWTEMLTCGRLKNIKIFSFYSKTKIKTITHRTTWTRFYFESSVMVLGSEQGSVTVSPPSKGWGRKKNGFLFWPGSSQWEGQSFMVCLWVMLIRNNILVPYLLAQMFSPTRSRKSGTENFPELLFNLYEIVCGSELSWSWPRVAVAISGLISSPPNKMAATCRRHFWETFKTKKKLKESSETFDFCCFKMHQNVCSFFWVNRENNWSK